MSKIIDENTLTFFYWTRKELNKEIFYKRDINISKNKQLIDFLEKNIDYIHKSHDKVKRIYGVGRNELKIRKVLGKNIYIINNRTRKGYRAILTKQKWNYFFIPFRVFQAIWIFLRIFIMSWTPKITPPPYSKQFYAYGKKELTKIDYYDRKKLQLWDTYFNKFEYYILVKKKNGFSIKEIDKKKYPSIKISMLFEWGYLPPRLKWYTTFNTNKKGEEKVRVEISELRKEINDFSKK